MDLKITAKLVLDQLDAVLCQISAEHYSLNISSLNASVSQHIRHILEFYVCLYEGLKTGVVNYDNRKRDLRIENDRLFTQKLIRELKEKINKEKIKRSC